MPSAFGAGGVGVGGRGSGDGGGNGCAVGLRGGGVSQCGGVG